MIAPAIDTYLVLNLRIDLEGIRESLLSILGRYTPILRQRDPKGADDFISTESPAGLCLIMQPFLIRHASSICSVCGRNPLSSRIEWRLSFCSSR